MASRLPVHSHARTFDIRYGWIAVSAFVGVYIGTRYGIDVGPALFGAQIVYTGTILAAAVLLTMGALRSPAGSRARRSWLLLGLSAGFIFLGESVFSAAVLSGHEASEAWTVLFDVANLGAAVSLVAALVVDSGIGRFGWRRGARLTLDALALITLAFAVFYRFWSERLPGEASLADASRLAAYCVLAGVIFVGGITTFGRRGARDLMHNRLLAYALTVLASGIALWAGTELAVGPSAQVIVGVSNTLMLASYGVMVLAAVARLNERNVATAAPLVPPSAWPGVIASTLVFASIVWLGVLALGADQGSVAAEFYLVAVSVAAVCVVGRTYLTYAEADELDRRSLTDPITGARGPRSFWLQSDALISATERQSRMPCLIDLDLDDFSRVNASRGYTVGDHDLTAVARALEHATGGASGVYRMRGNEFAVLARVRDPDEGMVLARSLLAAVRAAATSSALTASVGLAVYPVDAQDSEALLLSARHAAVWAKRHGKNRVVRFEPRIGSALSARDPFALPGEQAKADMARALLAAADARDPANHTHSRNVAALARLLAEDLGLDTERTKRVEMAAILHDVGKIALPDVMLGGRTLTFQERTVAREHPELGERLLDSLAVEGVGRWVRAHHENWDGSGYPDGLSGDDIPVEARVIALADAFDGMTMGKRYGAPMSHAAALQEIDLGIGVRFDPDLAERFIRVVATMGALGWSDEWGTA
ncbi:MAG: HD domain-containing protein [Coriobacteriia bacterium]|nr:HD domain-containing protein [Coriobacteriia bacterium]